MRAVVHDRYGDPADVLRLDPSAPVPEPAAGEVLVRVLVRPVLNPLMMLELLPAVADAWAGKPRPLLPTAAGSSVGRLVTAVSVQRDYALMNRVRSGAGAAALAERFPTVPTIARRLDLLRGGRDLRPGRLRATREPRRTAPKAGNGAALQPLIAVSHDSDVTPHHDRHGAPARRVEVEYIAPDPLPPGFDDRGLRRRLVQVAGVLVVVGLIAAFAPGLGELRDRLRDASPGWLLLAVVLEVLSCLSYVLMFKPVFCPRMSPRTAYELAMSELAVGSLVPASGAAGLAFGAWALRRGGMPAGEIARRSVAFFLLKSGANFVAVAVVGLVMWLGAGPHRSALLTLLPAVLAAASIVAVVVVGRRVRRGGRRWHERALGAVADGTREAGRILQGGDWRVIAGSLGYWAFDNAVLWATLRAFGESPAVTLVLMGYLIGQLGGLLPLPGGLGGIDGGLLGTLIVYGLPAAAVAAAILAYRVILFWIPLILGCPAFLSLRKALNDPDRPDICDPLARIAA